MTEERRIQLSWPQIAWGIAMLVAVLGAWFDLRGRVQSLEITMGSYQRTSQHDIDRIEDRIRRLEVGR